MRKKLFKHSITLGLASINLVIFLFRNDGFAYKQYIANSSGCNTSCIEKWNKPNEMFSQKDLAEGKRILQQRLSIDSFSTDEKKIIAIGGWLYNNFKDQFGRPDDRLQRMLPLQRFYALEANRKIQLWCGTFQSMFGLFCTSIGLPNRYFQLIGINNQSDSHVANEVFLKSYNKWVLTDGYQNHLLLTQNNVPLSAAEYLNHNIALTGSKINMVKQVPQGSFADTVVSANFRKDKYFNENYILQYYKTLDLTSVYATKNKIKRYFLPVTWYEIYAPQQKNSNFLFRLKQLFIFALALWLIFLVFDSLRSK